MGLLYSTIRSILSSRTYDASQPTKPEAFDLADLPGYRRGGRIIVLASGSEGEALKHTSIELVRPLESRASDILTIDCRDNDWVSQVTEALREPVWFALSHFGAGEDLGVGPTPEAANLWEQTGIPFIRVFGDTPAYFPDRHLQTRRNQANIYAYPEHADFLLRWTSPPGIVLASPSLLLDPVDESEIDFGAKTKGKIIFPKNGNDPSALIDYWRTRLPPTISLALESLSESLTSTYSVGRAPVLDESVVGHFRDKGIDISNNKRLVFFLSAQLDDFVRRFKSTLIAQSLLDFPVEIRGNSWQHIDFHGRRAQLISSADYAETRRLMPQSLGVIDMSPNTDSLPHDRVLRAAARWTGFITNKQEYYLKHFPTSEQFLFDFSGESISGRVDWALSHPRDFVELGRSQALRMRELAGESVYAERLCSAIDTCALSCGERPMGTQYYVSWFDN